MERMNTLRVAVCKHTTSLPGSLAAARLKQTHNFQYQHDEHNYGPTERNHNYLKKAVIITVSKGKKSHFKSK